MHSLTIRVLKVRCEKIGFDKGSIHRSSSGQYRIGVAVDEVDGWNRLDIAPDS
jgi:hypothetical protein